MATIIWKNHIVQESTIINHLNVLFKDNPIKCKKQSISGIGSNQRIIIVRNSYLQYYNIPKNYRQNDPKSIDLLIEPECKGRVHLQEIHSLSYLPEKKQKKKMIEMWIPYKKLKVKNQSAYKSAVKSQKNLGHDNQKPEMIQWIFQFNRDMKQLLRNRLKEDQQRKNKQQEKVKIDLDKDLKNGILNISSISSIQNKQGTNRKEISIISQQLSEDPNIQFDENLNKIRKLKQKVQFNEQMKRQQEKRLLKIKGIASKKRNNNLQANEDNLDIFPIRDFWRDYNHAYEKVLQSNQNYLTQDKLKRELDLLTLIYQFQNQARQLIKNYIDQKLVGWKPQKIKYLDFEFYKGVWIKLGNKELNQQYLINSLIANLCLALKSVKGHKIRVPLMVFAKYKSFKVLCMSDMPFSMSKKLRGEVYNLKGDTKQMQIQIIRKLNQSFSFLAEILGIKNQDIQYQNFKAEAPLGHDLKAYKYDNGLDQNTQTFLQNFYYIINLKPIFPRDYNYQKIQYKPDCWVRPQLICEWRQSRQKKFIQDNQLLAQAFQKSNLPVQVQQEQDKKVTDICDKFLASKALQLVKQIEDLKIIIIDSYSLKYYMSQYGINSRYLGLLYRISSMNYIKQFLLIQMLARCIKIQFKQTIHSMVENENFGQRILFSQKSDVILQKQKQRHNSTMKSCLIDFLNLVFGNGRQTHQFWKVISYRCKTSYNVQVSGIPTNVNPGCLLFSVLWHCQFRIQVTAQEKLFKTDNPFSPNSIQKSSYQIRTNSFQFPSLICNRISSQISRKDFDLDNSKQIQQILLPLMKFKIHNSFSRHQYNFQTQIQLARLNLYGKQFQKPHGIYNNHPSVLPYYFANKSPQNFIKALQIIGFGLVYDHPLNVALYDSYSDFMDPELLKKSALVVSIKGFGQFHPQTTQLYSKYFRQGYQQFQIKASRSQSTEGAFILAKRLINDRKYEVVLNFVLKRMQIRKNQPLKAGKQIRMYLDILKYGVNSASQLRSYDAQLQILEQFSQLLNTYKIQNLQDHHFVLYHSLVTRLIKTDKKYFIYKIVLLALRIQQKYQPGIQKFKDSEGFYKPRQQQQRVKIITEIIKQYHTLETHSKWIQNILINIRRGYMYFNYLNDLFNRFQHHLNNYGMADFKNSLGFLDTLVRYFGQRTFYDYLYEVN